MRVNDVLHNEIAELLKLWKRGLKISVIANMTGLLEREVMAIAAPEIERQRREWLKAEREERGIRPRARRVVPAVTKPRQPVPEAVYARPCGVTANLMGDPVYSRSALAEWQRRAPQEIPMEG